MKETVSIIITEDSLAPGGPVSRNSVVESGKCSTISQVDDSTIFLGFPKSGDLGNMHIVDFMYYYHCAQIRVLVNEKRRSRRLPMLVLQIICFPSNLISAYVEPVAKFSLYLPGDCRAPSHLFKLRELKTQTLLTPYKCGLIKDKKKNCKRFLTKNI